MKWPIVPLADLATKAKGSFVDGPFGSNLKASEYISEGVPILRLQNVRPNNFLSKDIKYVSPSKAAELARHSYSPGDLVISKLGDPPGFACVVPPSAGQGVIVADIVRFRGDPGEVDHRFLAYFLNSDDGRQQFLQLSKGTTRTRVNLTNIKSIAVPFPPIDEQKRIAAVLDMTDAIRRQRQDSLQLAEKLLQAVFIEMFGDPITNPKGWSVVDFGEEIETISYGTSTKCSEHSKPRSVPVLRIPNVTSGQISWENLKFALFSDAEWSKLRLRNGDILFVRTNGNPALVAKTAVFEEGPDAAYASYLIRARLKATSRLRPQYVNNALAIPSWRARLLLLARTTAGNYNINTESIKGLTLTAPPLALQDHFIRMLKSQWRVVASLNESLDQSDTLFNSIQQRAFRGELDLGRLNLAEVIESVDKAADEFHAYVTHLEGQGESIISKAFAPPKELLQELAELDKRLENGESIPWSADYFKYRLLGQQASPVSFADLLNKTAAIFVEQPPYEEIRRMIFELLEPGKGEPLLVQNFDDTRSEIVLELAS